MSDQRNRHVPGCSYVATVPVGETVLALLSLGGKLYVYTEKSVYELMFDDHRLVKVT